MDNAALAREILSGDASFRLDDEVRIKRYTISPWRSDYAMHCRRVGHAKVVSISLATRHYVGVGLRDFASDTFSTKFTETTGSLHGDRALADVVLLAEINACIEKGLFIDVRPFKYYRQGRLFDAALTGAIIDPYRVNPNLAKHMLFAHPTGKIVRLSETPGVCETADGEALAAEPMRLANHLRDDATLPQWWPIAFDFGMILPSFQRQP